MKITFKKHAKETGLRAIGYSHQDVDIKFDGQLVGWISAPTWQTKDRKWGIWVRVKEGDVWRNASFKCRFDDESAARKWVQDRLVIALANNGMIVSPQTP